MLDHVVISALVSALVAFAIEWAAKPSLEVRKDRILARARSRRAALGITRALLLRIGMPTPLLPASEQARVRNELEGLARQLGDQLVHGEVFGLAHELGAHSIGLLRGTLARGGSSPDVAALALPLELLACLLETHPLSLGHLVASRRARRWLALGHTPSPVT